MIGAILGDIIGSPHEYVPCQNSEFSLFGNNNAMTDDSILTIAVFCALERCAGNYDNLEQITARELIKWGNLYPELDYGVGFGNWLHKSEFNILSPYNSCGNGSAMRVSPVAYFARSLDECIDLARKVTRVTHNHFEGIIGAEATAIATYLALHGETKTDICQFINREYYSMHRSLFDIKMQGYSFDGTCQGTVPESIQAFLEAESFESAIRNTIMLGGDADTMGAITGAVAGAYFGIPKSIAGRIWEFTDDHTRPVIERMINFCDAVNRNHFEYSLEPAYV